MNVLTVSRKLTRIAAFILSAVTRLEAKAVGLHVRKLRDTRAATVSRVIEASRSHDKFCADQHQRHVELEAQTTRAIAALEATKRRAAVLSNAAALEIAKYGHPI